MAKQRSYRDQYAVVTGGASGLGLALVQQLVDDGATVLAVDLATERPPLLPETALYRRLDVTDEDAWDELAVWVEVNWRRLDLLVSNAGIAVGGRVDVTSLEDWDRIIAVNLMGVVKGVKAFVPMMKEQGSGHLVQTASLAGVVHAPGMTAYNTVKAGVVAFSETLQHELHPFGIDVSVICPSFFRTNLADSLGGKDVEMEQGAMDLITKAPRSAEQVGAAAFAGMRKRKFLIFTDQDGHAAYHAKRLARPALDRVLNNAGTQIRDGRASISGMDRLRALQSRRRR